MTEYYNDILCIEVSWLTGNDGVMTTSNFKQLKRRSHINQLRTGGNGRTALVEYSSIPQRFKDKIIEKIGDPRKMQNIKNFVNIYINLRMPLAFLLITNLRMVASFQLQKQKNTVIMRCF